MATAYRKDLMQRRIVIFLFYIPFLFNVVNAQAFLAKFTPASYAQVQLFAYFNVCAVIVGTFLIAKRAHSLRVTTRAWLFFYIVYYILALIGNIVFDTEPYKFLLSFIAPVYFLGFSVLATIPEEQKRLAKIFASGFLASCVLAIILDYINFSWDWAGVQRFDLSRAEGVYGDPNNTAVSALLSFILVNYAYVPKTKLQRNLKILALGISIYAALIAFSKTGFLVLGIILLLTFKNTVPLKRLLFIVVASPLLILGLGSYLKTSNLLDAKQLERIESLINLITFQTDKVDFSHRDVLLRNMFGYIESSPVIGHGIQFSNSIRGHNTIIGIWADAGILAFVVFLAVLIFFYIKAWQAVPKVKNLTLSILITLSVFMLSLQTILNQDYLMATLALVAVYIDQYRRRSTAGNRIVGYPS